jgi:hypothetical protein
MIGSNIYSQSFDQKQYINQAVRKTERLVREIEQELDRTNRFTLSQNKQEFYFLHTAKGRKYAFPDEFSCKAKIRNIEMRLHNQIDDIFNSIPSNVKINGETVSQKQKAEASRQIKAQMKMDCSCRRENNPNYNSDAKPDVKPDAKPYSSDNMDLTPDKNTPDNTNVLSGGTQTQYDNPFDAIAAAQTQPPAATNTQPSVNFDFSDMDKYVSNGSNGIYVGDENWKSPIIRVEPLENNGAYSLSKFDDLKKETTIDLQFRNEVATQIQAFLNGTESIPQFLDNLYKERTGYDIGGLRNKKYLTEEERKIVEDYNQFVKQMSLELDYQANGAKKNPNPEKNLIDFAIMANDVYDPNSKSLADSDWKPLVNSHNVDDEAIARTIDAINKFNNESLNNNSGFYAQIYKNELTGEYTLAFRGSELKAADWKNNVLQGFGAFSEQYAFAASIGECLSRSNAKINIVGHSLGGGLATVAGLKTGFPTYTYNQADISQGTIDRYKLDVSKSDNITAYYTEGEILTTLQNETREYNTLVPLGNKIKTGSAITIEENKTLSVVAGISKAIPNPLVKVAGELSTKADKVAMIDAHRMPHMEQYFRSVYGESQGKWERYNNAQLVLNNDNTYTKLFIETK